MKILYYASIVAMFAFPVLADNTCYACQEVEADRAAGAKSYDSDGGACDTSPLADIGYEGMIYIESDSRYIASGNFYIQGAFEGNGVTIYKTVDGENRAFFISTTPDGYISTDLIRDANTMRQEGNVNVMHLKECF